eukprot:scaffold33582_cov60-Phaeocystis_antarctica.AAC.2
MGGSSRPVDASTKGFDYIHTRSLHRSVEVLSCRRFCSAMKLTQREDDRHDPTFPPSPVLCFRQLSHV